jgi:hypothetical protein
MDMEGFGIMAQNSSDSEDSVGIATGYRLEVRDKTFLFSIAFKQALGPIQPPMQWFRGISPKEVKRPECETGHSPPSITKIKKGGFISPFLHACSLRDV